VRGTDLHIDIVSNLLAYKYVNNNCDKEPFTAMYIRLTRQSSLCKDVIAFTENGWDWNNNLFLPYGETLLLWMNSFPLRQNKRPSWQYLDMKLQNTHLPATSSHVTTWKRFSQIIKMYNRFPFAILNWEYIKWCPKTIHFWAANPTLSIQVNLRAISMGSL
jgi:hypothetical protein